MNIFQMYYANGKAANFWIQRQSWGTTVARVVSIGGQESGSLKQFGYFPYFNEAKEKVYAEMYQWEKDSDGTLLFNQIKPDFHICKHNPDLAIVSSPGTYSYKMLDLEGEKIKINRLDSAQSESITIPFKRYFRNASNYKTIEKCKKKQSQNDVSCNLEKLTITFLDHKECFLVSFEYDPEIINFLKAIPSKYRDFDGIKKHWIIDISQYEKMIHLKELCLDKDGQKKAPENDK